MGITLMCSEILRFAPNDDTLFILAFIIYSYLIDARSMYLSISIAWKEFAYFALICL